MFILNSLTSLARHGVAIAVFAICLGIQFWILPLEQGLAFLTFYPGTALTALLCGLGPTILYIVVAGTVGSYIFLPPYWSFQQDSYLPVTAFFVAAATILLTIHYFQRKVTQQAEIRIRDHETQQQLVQNLVQHRHDLELANTALLARETELAQAQRMANIASWTWDACTNVISPSPELCQMFGVEKFPTFAEQDGLLLPNQAWMELRATTQELIERGTGYNLELPAMHADGRQIWVNCRAEVVRDVTGKVISLRGMVQDITERKQAESIAQSERFIRTITDTLPSLVAYWDNDARCRFANKAYLEWFGKAPEQVIGGTMMELMGDALFSLNEPYIRGVLSGETQQFERTLTKADGSMGYTLAHYIPDIDGHGEVAGFYALVTDVTPIKRSQAELQLAAVVYQNTAEAIMVTDTKGIIQSVNPAFVQITGYTVQEAVGQTPRLLRSHHHDQEFHASVWRQINEQGFWQGEIWNRHKNGGVFLEWQTITRITGIEGAPIRYLSVFHDITETWQKNEHHRYLAFHDALTNLPNRALLMERLERRIAMTGREPRGIAVIFLDLDRFKVVNDTMGHAVGDDLLIALGNKVQQLVRQADTVARLGGDEFVIKLDNPANRSEVVHIAERVIATINEPMDIQGQRVQVGTSIGIAMYPDDGKTAAELIKNADAAMYEAKRAGRNGYRFFSQEAENSTDTEK